MALESVQESSTGRYVILSRQLQSEVGLSDDATEPFFWSSVEGWTGYESCDVYSEKLLTGDCLPSPLPETLAIFAYEEVKKRWQNRRIRDYGAYPIPPTCYDNSPTNGEDTEYL